MLLLLSPGTGTGLLATRGLDRSRQGPPPGAASASAQPVAGDAVGSLAAPSRLGIPRVVFLPSGGGGDDLSEFDLPPAPREGEYGSALASPLAGEYADWGSLARLPPAAEFAGRGAKHTRGLPRAEQTPHLLACQMIA